MDKRARVRRTRQLSSAGGGNYRQTSCTANGQGVRSQDRCDSIEAPVNGEEASFLRISIGLQPDGPWLVPCVVNTE